MFLLFMSIWAGAIGCLIVFAIFRSKARTKAKAKAGANDDAKASSSANGEEAGISTADDIIVLDTSIAEAIASGLNLQEHEWQKHDWLELNWHEFRVRPANQERKYDQAQIEAYVEDLRKKGSDMLVKYEQHHSRAPKAYALHLSKSKASSGRDDIPTIKVLR